MYLKKMWFFITSALLCTQVISSVLEGKVIHVDDGDTVIVLNRENTKINVRLSDIDAPEISHGQTRPGQPYSRRSTQSLQDLALGKIVNATCYEEDRYSRQVCTIRVSGIDVNAEQVRRGMAMANRANPRYLRNKEILKYEDEAREAGLGIWVKGQVPIEPWIWRKACWQKSFCGTAIE